MDVSSLIINLSSHLFTNIVRLFRATSFGVIIVNHLNKHLIPLVEKTIAAVQALKSLINYIYLLTVRVIGCPCSRYDWQIINLHDEGYFMVSLLYICSKYYIDIIHNIFSSFIIIYIYTFKSFTNLLVFIIHIYALMHVWILMIDFLSYLFTNLVRLLRDISFGLIIVHHVNKHSTPLVEKTIVAVHALKPLMNYIYPLAVRVIGCLCSRFNWQIINLNDEMKVISW